MVVLYVRIHKLDQHPFLMFFSLVVHLQSSLFLKENQKEKLVF